MPKHCPLQENMNKVQDLAMTNGNGTDGGGGAPATGPMSTGPMSTGPMATGPMASGPMEDKNRRVSMVSTGPMGK